MVLPKGRVAALLLPALLVLSPAAAQAQQHNCPHQNGSSQTGQFQGQSMNGTQQTSFLSQMSQMCGMRSQTSQTSTAQSMTGMSQPPFLMQMSQMCGMRSQTSQTSQSQSQQMQMFALRQIQMMTMQQTQFIAMQQQMVAMQQMIAMQQQPPAFPQGPSMASPPTFTGVPPPSLGLVQHKQTGALLKEMTAMQQRLDSLQEAAQRNEPLSTEATAAQQDVNTLQGEVDALAKPSRAVLERMSALRRQSDELLQQVTAKPADLIAAVRSGR